MQVVVVVHQHVAVAKGIALGEGASTTNGKVGILASIHVDLGYQVCLGRPYVLTGVYFLKVISGEEVGIVECTVNRAIGCHVTTQRVVEQVLLYVFLHAVNAPKGRAAVHHVLVVA